MTVAALNPAITPDDRLGMTTCIAVIVHTMIVLGVSFVPEPAESPRYESLEVILVSQRSETPPEDADMLAQANLEGGGEDEQIERPAAPIATPLPAPNPDVAATPAPPFEPRKLQAETADAVSETTAAPPQDATADAAAEQEEMLVRDTTAADLALPRSAARPAPPSDVASAEAVEQTPQPEVKTPTLPTASQLITRSFALASLNAELQQKLEMRSKRPRRKFISANAREYRYAAYMEAWRAKVERVGNINYPDEARRHNLSGDLLLDVALNPDGSVRNIMVRRSSGHKVLDDAAIRIVELAAPFAPFPEDILKEVDILHVTRTWKFLNSYQFSSR